ncbi:uncharacterized protein LOC143556522 [Bidens hawaiensis]|uniref:uncharacterized protein LOC143556522 n=1 Tax=Bidens hawaiensis TaxID=980011 RepID=UPI00404A62DC
MKDDESIDAFARKSSGMISRYSSLRDALEEDVLVRKLFDSVPEKYFQLVASIEQCSDIDSMLFEETIGRLKAYEDCLNQRKGNVIGRGFQHGGRDRGSYQDRGGRNRSRDRGSSRGRGGRWGGGSQHENENRSGRDKKHVKCFKCERLGHYASECPEGNEKKNEASLVKEEEDEKTLMLSICGENVPKSVLLNEEKVFPCTQEDQTKVNCEVWYLDNSASNHMTGVKDFFSEIDDKVMGQVSFGDGSKVQIEGKGKILFECKNGDQLLIPDVYFIPALRSNILSLGQLTEKGYEVGMKNKFLRVYNEFGKLLMKVERSKNRLYKIGLNTTRPICLKAKIDDESWLWHARIGHVNFRDMEMMVKRGLVKGVCEGCLVAKQTRDPFLYEAEWRADKPLKLVHADLCGPISPQTLGGPIEDNIVQLLLVDDEPTTFKEATEKQEWLDAMKTELSSIEKNETWSLVELPVGHKEIGLRWVFKLKKDAEGKVIKHKARLVAKGYVQKKGIDFDEPDGFVIRKKENMVYKLKKVLYGLRQVPRAWNVRLDEVLKEMGFNRCAQDPAVYKLKNSFTLIVGVYVDDLIVTGTNEKKINDFKKKMKMVFDMSDLGRLCYYLGIEVDQDGDGISIK